MLVLHDPATLLHSTVELIDAKLITALESPDRLRAILSALEASPHELRTVHVDADTQSGQSSLKAIILQNHDSSYIHHLEHAFTDWLEASLIKADENILPECFRFPTHHHPDPPHPPKDISARAGYYAFDMSSGLMASSFTSILASANLAYEGTRLLFSPPSSTHTSNPSTILALTRPPGHHCDGRLAGGYCYINNAAVAVSAFQFLHMHSTTPSRSTPDTKPTPKPKSAILDLDFHHGNGTQEIFYSEPHALYTSIHGQDEFPYYAGSVDETGAADGQGFNVNFPLQSGASFAEYLETLSLALKRIRDFDPAFLIVSLGFDTFHLDPLGKFEIETEDYARMASEVRRGVMGAASAEGQLKCLILLEGGYVIERLGENVLSFLRGWEGQ